MTGLVFFARPHVNDRDVAFADAPLELPRRDWLHVVTSVQILLGDTFDIGESRVGELLQFAEELVHATVGKAIEDMLSVLACRYKAGRAQRLQMGAGVLYR